MEGFFNKPKRPQFPILRERPLSSSRGQREAIRSLGARQDAMSDLVFENSCPIKQPCGDPLGRGGWVTCGQVHSCMARCIDDCGYLQDWCIAVALLRCARIMQRSRARSGGVARQLISRPRFPCAWLTSSSAERTPFPICPVI